MMDALPLADDPPTRSRESLLGFIVIVALFVAAVAVAVLVAPR